MESHATNKHNESSTSLTMDRTLRREQSVSHWTTREVPGRLILGLAIDLSAIFSIIILMVNREQDRGIDLKPMALAVV